MDEYAEAALRGESEKFTYRDAERRLRNLLADAQTQEVTDGE